MGTVKIETSGGVHALRIARPEVRNALNEGVIADLTRAFQDLPSGTRVVVLSGEGPAFCSGADIEWMRRSKHFTRDENERDAAALAAMLQAVDECPVPVVARIHGASLGGGAGLAAACDVALAESGTRFGFPEVRLGLIPAVISTFVVPRIGSGAARRYFLTGERFGAAEAQGMGLIHESVPEGDLDDRVQAVVSEILKGGPLAQRAAKRLIRSISLAPPAAAVKETIRLIAEIRTSPEAQEGLSAFLEKRKPNWP